MVVRRIKNISVYCFGLDEFLGGFGTGERGEQ